MLMLPLPTIQVWEHNWRWTWWAILNRSMLILNCLIGAKLFTFTSGIGPMHQASVGQELRQSPQILAYHAALWREQSTSWNAKASYSRTQDTAQMAALPQIYILCAKAKKWFVPYSDTNHFLLNNLPPRGLFALTMDRGWVHYGPPRRSHSIGEHSTENSLTSMFADNFNFRHKQIKRMRLLFYVPIQASEELIIRATVNFPQFN